MSNTPTAPGRGLEKPDDVQSPERSVSDRKVFDAVIAKYKDAGDREERALPQEPVAPPVSAPDPSTSGDPPQQEQAAPVETPAPSSDPTLRAAAEKFLALKTGSPASVFTALSEEAVLAWAEERRTRETSVDGVYRRAAEAERELDQLRNQKATEAAKPTGPTAAEDLEAAKKTLVEELSLTDEGRDALERMIDLRMKPLEDKIAEQQETVAASHTRGIIKTVEQSRVELGKRFVQFADDKTFTTLLDEMERLETAPRFAGSGRHFAEYSDDLMTAAARSLGIEEKMSGEALVAQQAAQEELHERVGGGMPIGDRQAPASPVSKESQDRAVYDEIRKRSRLKHGAVG